LVLVYVVYTLTSVPDDDPRNGSKHVGLVYRDYKLYLKIIIMGVHLLVEYFMFD
jgi:hypothetical protein